LVKNQTQTLVLAVPVYNEQDQIEAFLTQIRTVLSNIDMKWSVLFVDDGSHDATVDRILAFSADNPAIELIVLSRNFGKEAALTAALDHAEGDAVIPIDVDLQDPPELIPKMVEAWRGGADIVHARRHSRRQDTFFKRNSARIFYLLMHKIGDTRLPENVGDFRLIDRKVVLAIREIRERNRFMKGILSWPGFHTVSVNYDRPGRDTGQAKQGFRQLIKLALDGLVSFSVVPLRIWVIIGSMISFFAFVYMTWIILSVLIFGRSVPGYASLMTIILFMGGMQLLSVGILGEYLSQVFIEVKQRPIYLIDSHWGKEDD